MRAVAAYSLHELARLLGLKPDGIPDVQVHGIAALDQAGPSQLSFYTNKRYYRALAATRAAAVILRAQDAVDCPVPVLVSRNPYADYARLSQLFVAQRVQPPGVDASARVDPSARIADSAHIGAYVTIGARTIIGAGAVVEAHCVIGERCVLGAGTHLMSHVTLYDEVRIGDRGLVHAGAVLGSDGFGFAPDGERHVKIAQLGGVEIGDDVEIGACTSIDRGALDDTEIGDGVKIDNQVQIAHNVRIGDNSIICGCSAIAGSSVIGKNCIIAGAVGVINHVTICDGVTVTAMSLVNQSINQPGVYSSGTGLSESGIWRRNIVRFRQLEEFWKRLERLEAAGISAAGASNGAARESATKRRLKPVKGVSKGARKGGTRSGHRSGSKNSKKSGKKSGKK